MKKIYVDTEYVYEGMFYEKRMPKESDQKEIIQIAAVLFDHEKGVEIDSFDILVKPVLNKKFPNFFIELTKITEDMVNKKGVSFPIALNKFVKFCKNYPILTFNNDYNVFLQNLKFHSINNPFKQPFIRVKPMLKNFGINPNKYSSGNLYKAVGLNLKGHVHNALHDVRSMSQAIHILEQKINL